MAVSIAGHKRVAHLALVLLHRTNTLGRSLASLQRVKCCMLARPIGPCLTLTRRGTAAPSTTILQSEAVQ